MNSLLKLRENLKNIYKSADVYILPAFKFLLAFAVFYLINKNIGYLEVMNSMFIVVILSLVCAILPVNGTVIFAMALVVVHSFGLGAAIGILALCIYLVLFLLFFRFVMSDGMVMVLTPIAFMLNVPSVIPITLGMFGRASSAIASACSVMSFFFMRQLPYAAELIDAGELSSLEIIKEMMDSMLGDNEMILLVVVFVAVTLSVSLVKRQITTYTWLVSALVGTGLYIVLVLFGESFLDLDSNSVYTVIGALMAAVISLVIAFFMINVDYKGSRYIQFEDDDYYYFVKAVPKNKPIDINADRTNEDIAYFQSEEPQS